MLVIWLHASNFRFKFSFIYLFFWLPLILYWLEDGENPLRPMLCCISEILNFYLFYQELCSCKWTFFLVDVKYPKVASWDSFFQGSVSRVLLTLVGSPPGSSPNNKPDPNRSVDTVPVSDKQAVKSQETSPVNGKCKVSVISEWKFVIIRATHFLQSFYFI